MGVDRFSQGSWCTGKQTGSHKNVFLMINNKSLHGISSPLKVVLINVAHSLEISVPRSKPAVLLSGTISGANWDKNMPF